MTGPPKIAQAHWDKHKAYLHDLYITRDKTLSQVLQQAEDERGFRPRCVNVSPLTILIILTATLVRRNTYDSSKNGNSRRTCVLINGRKLLRWYGIERPTAKTARYSSMRGEYLTEDYEKRCPATGHTNMMIAQVSKFDRILDQNSNTARRPKS